MLQFQGEQFNVEELKYIYSALMMVQVSGEEARTLVNLQDKTMKIIQMIKKAPQSSPPGKRK